MSGDVSERRLAALLAADVAGYSRLVAGDPDGTARALSACREEVARVVPRHLGRLVDFAGDAFLAEFPSALDAVRAAAAIQRSLAQQNAARPAERRVHFRMGVDVGDVVSSDGRLTGDAVNAAARLQELAPAGGLCVSGAAHAQVHGALELAFEDLGERELKNIPRAVRAYRARLETASPSPPRTRLRTTGLAVGVLAALVGLALWASWPRPLGLLLDWTGAGVPPVNPALPDKPSLVVLPFANLSGDPEQEYFSDGITEDLITDLSRSPRLFVIARNSAFTYKGRAVNVADVGRELGVQYVVEGSLRRDANRIRVTAQLIDATSGFHVWSERYDRELADLFGVQAELAERIMGAVGTEIYAAEIERIRRRPTDNLSAHDLVMRGTYGYMQFTREGHERARELFERAIELDPEYVEPHAMLSGIYVTAYGNLWSLDPALPERALSEAERAVAIDPSNPYGLAHKALALLILGRAAEAQAYARRAIELDPNWNVPYTLLAFAQVSSGDPLAALRSTSRALRRNPRLPSGDLQAIAMINYRAGRTDIAQDMFERIRASNPDLTAPRLILLALYDSQGRHDEARALVREILLVNPELTTELVLRHPLLAQTIDADMRATLGDQLRRAGFP